MQWISDQVSKNKSAPKLENRKTSPCSPCAPNLLHVLVSWIPGYHNLCSPGQIQYTYTYTYTYTWDTDTNQLNILHSWLGQGFNAKYYCKIPEIHKIKYLHINTQIFPSLGALVNISKEDGVDHGEGERMLGSSQFIGDYNLAAGHHQPRSCNMQCIIFAIFAKSHMSNISIA